MVPKTLIMEKTRQIVPTDLHSHVCYFYEKKEDLLQLITGYMKDAITNNEACLCIASDDLMLEETQNAIRESAPLLNEYVKRGQIEFVSYKERFAQGNPFSKTQLQKEWIAYEKNARKRKYKGLRIIYNTSWLEKENWDTYLQWQHHIHNFVKIHSIGILTTYALYWHNTVELFLGAVNAHGKILVGNQGNWNVRALARIEIPRQGTPLHEKYAQVVVSLDKIIHELLPMGKRFGKEVRETRLVKTKRKITARVRTAKNKITAKRKRKTQK